MSIYTAKTAVFFLPCKDRLYSSPRAVGFRTLFPVLSFYAQNQCSDMLSLYYLLSACGGECVDLEMPCTMLYYLLSVLFALYNA